MRIVPPGTEASERIDIVMARGAFGSGEHETTASCLEVIEGLPLEGARVLDVGSGTGILSIACLRLGAASAVCVDIEARAVASARENAELNGVGARATHVCGQLGDLAPARFDLVLANLYGDVLLALAGELATRVRRGGTVLLSGLLWEDQFGVAQRMERVGLHRHEVRMLAEYSTLVLERRATPAEPDPRARDGVRRPGV